MVEGEMKGDPRLHSRVDENARRVRCDGRGDGDGERYRIVQSEREE